MRGTKITFLIILIFAFFEGSSQVFPDPENPPVPVKVEVRNAQGLNFGVFTVGTAGGNVTLTYNGERFKNGDVQLLTFGSSSHFAIFDVYANPGTLIHIQPVAPITMSGPSGSNILLLIDPFVDISTGQTFITTGNPHPVQVGGKLIIPNGNVGPAGNYNASFTLTFINE